MRGSRHFLYQRLTALALIPLVIWFCFFLAKLPGANYAEIVTWLQSPRNAILLALMVMLGLYHGELGVRVVIEDYIAPGRVQRFLLALLKFLRVFLITLGLFFLFRIMQVQPS